MALAIKDHLPSALISLHDWCEPNAVGPVASGQTLVTAAGYRYNAEKSGVLGAGSQVARVASDFEDGAHSAPDQAAAERRGDFEERAAILEYDGGYSRAEAERRARLELSAR